MICFSEVNLGNRSTKVGINTLPYSPLTALEVNGAVSLRSAVVNVGSGGTIIVGDRSFISVYNNTQAFNVIHLSNGISPGQLLILMGDPSTGFYGGTFIDEANLNVDNQVTIAAERTLTLIWSGSKWVELSHSLN